VPDAGEAVIAMGNYARSRMTGKVIAVTGSAGKTTTVAMAAHVLSAFGTVRQSAFNANLPHGVAWNLASIPWDTGHAVLELAVGRMAVSARMARPDIAIFTNVGPAHLGDRSTPEDIARTKSGIFLGMCEGACAILNRDMAQWDIVLAAAKARKLRVTAYGASPSSDARLVDFDPARREVHARIEGKDIRYRIGSSGRHMALNSIAVLSAVRALGYELEPAIERLSGFLALPGRGEILDLKVNGRAVRVIDDAYNANPGSMAAALERLSGENGSRRVAVLGEMAELGPSAARYHTELAGLIAKSSIDRVYVTGELYRSFWDALPQPRRGAYAESAEALKEAWLGDVADGDVVLFKGSHSTRIHLLVSWLRELQAHGPG
jgi:UDP-N-acetylmuramoyl-tripeptide--D-alanyl-D-alanine ligase